MDKFITYKEQELKDNIKWIETYTESIISTCDSSIVQNTSLTLPQIASVKGRALSILKQLEDFNLNS